MSSKKFLRTEQVHIDEVSCRARSTIQWFAENKNNKGSATHPISHNNTLTLHICGKEGFAAIAKDIAAAERSIDLACWGFDPGMELVRNGYNWPRAETFGDLLIAAGRRGVQVRLLVWYSLIGGIIQKNMPGHTHGTAPWRRPEDTDEEAQRIHAKRSLQLIQEHARNNRHKKSWSVGADKLAAMAREEYCCSWYKAAFAGRLRGITILTRDGNATHIQDSLNKETRKPDLAEQSLLVGGGTHHQKPILIDLDYEGGKKAVGYVMGLNALTDYWDTPEHCVENLLREQGADKTRMEHAEGIDGFSDFETLKPYRDYACRIDGGQALIALHENFLRAWKRAGGDKNGGEYVCESPPSALLRNAESGDSTVQIVRTQPEEGDFTIKEIYFNAARVAAGATGYLYMENQYFQYQDWAEHLLAVRKNVIANWNSNCTKIGKSEEDLPVLHVFVVIPAPEKEEMIPRTYDTLATLGQQGGLTGQVKMIEDTNEAARIQREKLKQPRFGNTVDWKASMPLGLPEVVATANRIDKPSWQILKKKYGLRVCVAVLNACEFNQARRQWRYREIYIHSKLLLVDDGFLTLGSANLNQRSMVGDSEINLATDDRVHAIALRKRIWSQLATEEFNGGNATPQEITDTFDNWVKLMRTNKEKQKATSIDPETKQMKGLIVPLDDGRSSTIRFA